MRRLYGRRREVMHEALARHFGDHVTISGEAAGTYLVVRFACGVGSEGRSDRGVTLASTARYYVSGAAPHEYILRFSGISERAIREGIRRLAS